jgi:SAM-dependent methyltransferase
MSQSNNLYKRYLSNYFVSVGDIEQVRAKKLALLQKNYEALFPESSNAKILEIGPGHGELIEVLNQKGYINAQAIDISTEVVEYCNQNWPGCTSLVQDSARFLQEHQRNFDMVFMLHVLEHIPKEQIIPLLKDIHGSLVDGGQLIVEVPNMANPVTGLYTRYVDFTHEVGFVDGSLAFVLKEAGFSKISIHSLKVPHERWYRYFQIIFNKIFELCYRLLQFALGIRGSNLIAHAIFAHAKK